MIFSWFHFSEQVSLGWGHTLAQTDDGKLYGWGYAADGRLGQIGRAWETSLLEGSYDSSKITPLSSTTLEAAEKLVLKGMEKEKHMPIIWEPILIEDMHDFEVVDVACGLDHSLVLCSKGLAFFYFLFGKTVTDQRFFPF